MISQGFLLILSYVCENAAMSKLTAITSTISRYNHLWHVLRRRQVHEQRRLRELRTLDQGIRFHEGSPIMRLLKPEAY